MIKNCCFQTEHHDWLLSESVDLLPKLLLPLAGPEEFDDEEMDKLPIELQYLGEEKTRESDADVRKMLIEALTQVKLPPIRLLSCSPVCSTTLTLVFIVLAVCDPISEGISAVEKHVRHFTGASQMGKG